MKDSQSMYIVGALFILFGNIFYLMGSSLFLQIIVGIVGIAHFIASFYYQKFEKDMEALAFRRRAGEYILLIKKLDNIKRLLEDL